MVDTFILQCKWKYSEQSRSINIRSVSICKMHISCYILPTVYVKLRKPAWTILAEIFWQSRRRKTSTTRKIDYSWIRLLSVASQQYWIRYKSDQESCHRQGKLFPTKRDPCRWSPRIREFFLSLVIPYPTIRTKGFSRWWVIAATFLVFRNTESHDGN